MITSDESSFMLIINHIRLQTLIRTIETKYNRKLNYLNATKYVLYEENNRTDKVFRQGVKVNDSMRMKEYNLHLLRYFYQFLEFNRPRSVQQSFQSIYNGQFNQNQPAIPFDFI